MPRMPRIAPCSRFLTFLAVLVGAAPVADLRAENRFVVESRTVHLGSGGNEVVILADADEDVYGFSVSLEFDESVLQVVDVQLGSDVAAVDPEWNVGEVDNAAGELVHGVVFDLSGPTITKSLSAGPNMEFLRLTIDVLATSETTTTLDLVNVPSDGVSPIRWNLMADQNGGRMNPEPTLVDGNVTVADLAPAIQSYLDNAGEPDQVFFVIGTNFDQPGLAVSVGGVPAAHALLADNQTVQVTAPGCNEPGPAAVEVCTSVACDADAAGFTYTGCGPVAAGIIDIRDNVGRVGKVFTIIGSGFAESNLAVTVGGAAAPDIVLLPDGATLEVAAPACVVAGWAAIEVCNDLGCDSEDMGFFYESCDGSTMPFVRADANDSGALDLSDAVAIFLDLFAGVPAAAPCEDALDSDDSGEVNMTDGMFILNALFRRGGPIPPPFPEADLDPTEDSLAGC